MPLKKIILVLLLFGSTAQAQVTFIIEALPSGTQNRDTIFVCGNFNNWMPKDKRFIVQKQLNGQLAVTVPTPLAEFEYKFTRGDWMRVETNALNQLTPNRMYKSGQGNVVYIHIDNWLDLGGARPFNYIILFFFGCAFQCIALCLMMVRTEKKDQKKLRSLIAINLLLVVLLLLVVVFEISNQIWQSYLVFVFHISLFCWSTVLIYFFKTFTGSQHFPKLSLYFLPAVVAALLVLVRISNFSLFNFASALLWPPFTRASILFIGAGFAYNLYLHIKIFRLFRFVDPSGPHERSESQRFLYYFFWISFVAVLLIPVNVVLVMLGFNHSFLEDFYLIAIVLSTLIFVETYFIWRYPEIIKEEKPHSTHNFDTGEWPKKLDALMISQKPYKNPELSLSDLAELLGTKPHVLSRVINDHHDKNFRDFVNQYRVEEFIALSQTPHFKNYTFLALAQEVGFNSKSTFNLAFKKLTNQNPRDYFKTHAPDWQEGQD
ncbi:MAG: helix-turn-helix domain-containing protein [Cyclobacteriaceae bacterium]|jgi:AraC-like DNA-binding protein